MKSGNDRTASRAKFWLFGLSLLAATGLHATQAAAHTKTSHVSHLALRHATTHHEYARAGHHHDEYAARTTQHHDYAAYEWQHGEYHHSTRLAWSRRHANTRLAHEYYHHRHTQYAAQYRHSYLQCVPYAREVSHIELSGDAFLWWAEAAGRYARGDTPAEGAVLNFRPIGRMPLGHVAVVTSVIDNRTVLVTQANWVRGTITNDVTVEDVSQNNDWSEVQVELGDGARLGAPYPTYGFIYNQPDNGTVIAGNSAQGNEVAEAPRPAELAADAPDRNLQ
jgi:surface antigen